MGYFVRYAQEGVANVRSTRKEACALCARRPMLRATRKSASKPTQTRDEPWAYTLDIRPSESK